MCCAYPVTSTLDNPFNALPENWASDPELLAGLRVDDDDEHDDPFLRWPDGRVVDTFREDYPYPEKMDELQRRLDGVLLERPSRLEPLITGDDIMRIRGINAGPEVGRVKRKLEELVIDGEIAPDRDAITNYLSAHPNL